MQNRPDKKAVQSSFNDRTVQGSVHARSTLIQKEKGREKENEKEKNVYKAKDLNPHTGEQDRGSNTLMENWLKKPKGPTQLAIRSFSILLYPI